MSAFSLKPSVVAALGVVMLVAGASAPAKAEYAQWTWSRAATIDQRTALVFPHPPVSLYPSGDALAVWPILNEVGTETVMASAYY